MSITDILKNRTTYVVGIDQSEHRVIGIYEDFEAAEKVAIKESLSNDFDKETYRFHYIRFFTLNIKKTEPEFHPCLAYREGSGIN